MGPLISPDELAALLGRPDLRIVDGSWHLDGRDARADFARAHLPGAVFFDLEAVSDPASPLPHMLPAPADFAAAVGALGVSETDVIVVYDTAGLFSAARVWWMFRVMGAVSVRVLDGGLPAWRRQGRPIESGPAAPNPARFRPAQRLDGVADLETVRRRLARGDQVIDARGAPRFRGEAAEPRPGVRPGHMPDAINLPYNRLLQDDGAMKRGADLARAFAEAGIDIDRPITTSCGSGVTAAILNLGLAELGRDAALYDGSWAEWGGRADTPVQTG
ncbi:3-mercaptopyruvate sulfurtransferase [Brevundimonas sp. UBA7534]|uniref:3-mercaptopyruvate sulfurtransferase n=1 Tax=Brevundimonas sp. UBA7534 TaxID=1946138 RepID=UPI0025BBAF60|nr:3-mercaptopyruvate sulfurtransferase [Brevundimonas sp. UBA7534]